MNLLLMSTKMSILSTVDPSSWKLQMTRYMQFLNNGRRRTTLVFSYLRGITVNNIKREEIDQALPA